MKDVIVIGAGPAGCAAAVQCRRMGLEVLLIDGDGHAGGLLANAYLVENYPGLEAPISGLEFAGRLKSFLSRFNLEIVRDTATSVGRRADHWVVQTEQGETLTRTVVIATGTAPCDCPMEGMAPLADAGMLYHEVKHLLPRMGNTSQVVVMGGGEASFDYALSLAARGAWVRILCRSKKTRVTGRLEEMVERSPRVVLLLEHAVISAQKSEQGQTAYVTAQTPDGIESFQCDALLVAIGRQQIVSSLVENYESISSFAGLTPAPGLFICGDARRGTLGQAGIAVGDGLAAAMDIADFIRSAD